MERLTFTTLQELQPGSIFYKAGDAKKTKLIKTMHDSTGKKHTCVDAGVMPQYRHKDYLKRFLSGATQVVFLRLETL